jgi:hypothetical protein
MLVAGDQRHAPSSNRHLTGGDASESSTVTEAPRRDTHPREIGVAHAVSTPTAGGVAS